MKITYFPEPLLAELVKTDLDYEVLIRHVQEDIASGRAADIAQAGDWIRFFRAVHLLREESQGRMRFLRCNAQFANPDMPCQLGAGHDGSHRHLTVTWNYDARED